MTPTELRTLRTEHGLTQRTFAELLGYHVNYIARLERGEWPIIPQRIEKIVRLLFREKKSEKSS